VVSLGKRGTGQCTRPNHTFLQRGSGKAVNVAGPGANWGENLPKPDVTLRKQQKEKVDTE